MKRCARCGEEKNADAFSVDRTRKDGLQPYCKACNRAYHAANADEISRRMQDYYDKNADRIKDHVRNHRIENSDRVNARRRELHAAKAPEKNAARRLIYSLNPARILDQMRAHRQANIERERERERARYYAEKDRYVAQARNRKARKKAAEGSFSASEWRELKRRYDYRCLRCDRSEPDIQLTPDHVIPLARGGSNYITNIQPLCLECNLWKSTKTIDYR